MSKELEKKRATMDEQYELNVKLRKRIREIICRNAANAINALDDASFADEHLKPTIDELEIKIVVRFGRGPYPMMDTMKMEKKKGKP